MYLGFYFVNSFAPATHLKNNSGFRYQKYIKYYKLKCGIGELILLSVVRTHACLMSETVIADNFRLAILFLNL